VEERVLDSVLSVLVLADHARCDRERLVFVAADEFLEGGLAAVAAEAASIDSVKSPVRRRRQGGRTGCRRRHRRGGELIDTGPVTCRCGCI